MKGKLIRYELYKVLFSYKILWLAIAFILIKAAVLGILPELKDSRIGMSSKQYDKVMEELAGETSPEKEQYIMSMHEHYQSILEQHNDNMNLYLSGQMDEKSWDAFSKEHRDASLFDNAFSILNEKAEDFASLRIAYDLPPQAFFYEYGWNSVFTYMSFPDPILFIFAIILGIQFICPEISSGAMQIALASRNGRRPLFISKLVSLLILLGFTAIINIMIEVGILYSRFYLGEGHWPLYSIAPYVTSPIKLNLIQALVRITVIRHIGFILTGILAFTIAGLAGNTSHGIFITLLLILLPWLLIPNIPFTISAWLSGAPILKGEYQVTSLIVLIILVAITTWISYRIRFYRK